MIFRQKKIKKKQKIFKIIILRVDFVPQSQHPSVSSPTTCIIPNAQCHPERCASSYALASKNDSGSHHSSTKPLIPGFPIRSSSSSSQAPPAVDCSAGPPIASTPQKVLHSQKYKEKLHQTSKQNQRAFAQNRMCKNVHLNRKPIFFLRSESRRSRLTRVPCWCQRFSYTIKTCSPKRPPVFGR